MRRKFYSNGKLLLSGEYVILDGALGLAIPTKYGHSLQVASAEASVLDWESLDKDGLVWFHGSFELESFAIRTSSDIETAKTLQQLLRQAQRQNPSFLNTSPGCKVVARLDFPKKWGLGTSSTLINNIAQWAGVDAYRLLWKAFGGSGYDIACARHDRPVLYRLHGEKANVGEVHFDPPFKDSLYFVHLNKKQSSKQAVQSYKLKQFNKEEIISRISGITEKMAHETGLDGFKALMREHEAILSATLGIRPVKSALFPDYFGSIKSLGAWGGDFILATGDASTPDYFKSKGFETVVAYADMALDINAIN